MFLNLKIILCTKTTFQTSGTVKELIRLSSLYDIVPSERDEICEKSGKIILEIIKHNLDEDKSNFSVYLKNGIDPTKVDTSKLYTAISSFKTYIVLRFRKKNQICHCKFLRGLKNNFMRVQMLYGFEDVESTFLNALDIATGLKQ